MDAHEDFHLSAGLRPESRLEAWGGEASPAGSGGREEVSLRERFGEAAGFVLGLARALHQYGTNAHRLESSLGAVSQRLGLEASFFSTPTAIFVSIGPPGGEARTVLLRVEPGDVNLEKLGALDAVAGEVMRGELAPREAARRVRSIVEARTRYGPLATVAAFALASAGAARFFAGGWREMVAGGLVGLLMGLLAEASAGHPALQRVYAPLAGALAASLSLLFAGLLAPLSVYTVLVSGLIVLVPGLTLTVAMAELATNNLASGSSRLAGTVLVFLTMAFGVALGQTATSLLVGPAAIVDAEALPAWTELVALLVSPLGFAVLFRAAPKDLPWVALAGYLAYAGARAGSLWLGPQLGAFVGAVAVAAGANLFARTFDRPASIPLVPGLIFLVPGSIGFQSLSSLLRRDVVSGVETAFSMSLVAVALVTGLLVANVLVPPRKAL